MTEIHHLCHSLKTKMSGFNCFMPEIKTELSVTEIHHVCHDLKMKEYLNKAQNMSLSNWNYVF